MWLVVACIGTLDGTYIESGVRPDRLCKVFDGAGKAAVAFDQKNVPWFEQLLQCRRIARCKVVVASHRFFEVAHNYSPYTAEHSGHCGLLEFSAFCMHSVPFDCPTPNRLASRGCHSWRSQ